MTNFTKGKWKAHKNPTQEWVITDDTGEFIAGHLRHWNKDLILAAVNACIKLNPDNPMTVAESIKEMYEALKGLLKPYAIEMGIKYPAYPQYWVDVAKALAKAESK